MKQLLRAPIILSVLLCIQPALAGGLENRQPYFRIFLPDGFDITKKSPVEDFEIYTVSKDNAPYVRIYVGNAPDFPQIATFPDERITVLKTREMSLLSKWEDGGISALETLIVRQTGPGWPRFVHAWTTPTAPDKRLAQKILLSLDVEEESQ